MQQNPDHHSSPWHAGEKTLQEKAGVSERMEAFGQKVIRDYMPDQHRIFYHQLPFMVAASVDALGRPWATLLEGPEGFVSSPDPRQLTIDTQLPADDPATPGLAAGQAVGLLGIELHTRRRNRLNGQIHQAGDGQLQVTVEQSFGNCPQYIQLRDYTRVAEPAQGRVDATTLDASAVSMIQAADTFFVASYVEHVDGQRSVDVSHRGGRPGFIKVEGNRLTIPDYAGNLHFNTLGNLLVNPQAGLLFIDFSNGNVLQLCGRAEVLLDSPAIQAFEGAERLWTLQVEQVVWRPAAVALRWAFKEYAPTSLMTGTWAEADARLEQRQQQRQWLAWRVLRDEVRDVEHALQRSLPEGQQQVARLVSRDVSSLSEAQVRQAAISTLAENLNDSVVAPLFWFVLFGLPGAAVYRFANTADAMWGYRGERAGRDWTWAGKWAARADDVLSWVPVRITAFLICLLFKGRGLTRLPGVAQQTPSPNGGWPMGALALGMNICLEKKGVYCLNVQGDVPRSGHIEAALHACAQVVVFIAVFCMAAVLWRVV